MFKIGDKIVCIDDYAYSYGDDLYWDETNFLINYHIYTIYRIRDFSLTNKKSYCELSLTLKENVDIDLDSNRFISTQEYRKLKLNKLNGNTKR